MSVSFFPKLGPRSTYRTKADGTYLVYSSYRTEIEEDCRHRCVYCDIHTEEHGFEGMVLDHFRPQEHFGALVNNPNNLVLSCPVCNRLKSYYWPIDPSIELTFSGLVGFLDPFVDDRSEYFSVSTDGKLEALKHPALYLEKLLNLNRISRIKVRQRRILRAEIKQLLGMLSSAIPELLELRERFAITEDDYNSRKSALLEALDALMVAVSGH